MIRQFIGISAAALIMSGASAQSPQAGSHNPVVKDGTPHGVAAPANGANSFTEDQARGRFAKAGYTGISKPAKNNGLWQATAMKAGKRVTVMLDYKGNITTR